MRIGTFSHGLDLRGTRWVGGTTLAHSLATLTARALGRAPLQKDLSAADCEGERVDASAGTESTHAVSHMRLDGLAREGQPRGDLFALETLSE